MPSREAAALTGLKTKVLRASLCRDAGGWRDCPGRPQQPRSGCSFQDLQLSSFPGLGQRQASSWLWAVDREPAPEKAGSQGQSRSLFLTMGASQGGGRTRVGSEGDILSQSVGPGNAP